jgi:hypothetical protein
MGLYVAIEKMNLIHKPFVLKDSYILKLPGQNIILRAGFLTAVAK